MRRGAIAAVSLLLTTQAPVWPSRELRDGHIGQVEGVAFSPDGRWLASADNSGSVIVRSLPGFDVVATLRGANFTEIAWTDDGATLVAGGFDSLTYVWQSPFTQPARTLRYPGPVEAVAITPGGVLLAAGGGERSIRRWRLVSGEALPPLRGHTDDIYAVRVHPNGRLIASGGRDRTIRIWDPSTRRPRRILRGHGDSVYDLAFSSDGALLVSGCRDGTVGVWSTRTWTLQRLLRGPSNSVHGVALSPNGRWLAGADFDNQVWIWRLADTVSAQTLMGHRRKVSGVAFSPDGHWLASAASDTTVRIWTVP
jgi:WD40 repeat protein